MTARRHRGFTLIELMIVVMIIALLAGVGVPMYQESVRKSYRSVAKTKLMELAARQEQYFSDNKTYADDLTLLGVAANPMSADSKGSWVAVGSSSALYTLSVTTTNAGQSFTLTATAAGSQAKDSAKCATLTLTETGLRGGTGSLAAECWN